MPKQTTNKATHKPTPKHPPKATNKATNKATIIRYFMSTSKGIKATAGYFGLPRSKVGKIINQYKKKHNIR